MPTLQEILAAKKLAQAKAAAPALAPVTTTVPNTVPTTNANTSKVVQGTAVVAGQPTAVTTAHTEAKEEPVIQTEPELKKDAEPVSTPSEATAPTPSAKPTTQEPPQFAKNLADELRSMAQEQDWLDVEQSANSLNEILSVILDLPYPPDVFIDECIDNAACALENQKNRYLHDVLNGKKQSGKRQKASADMSPLQQAIELDKLGDDDIFVFDPLAGIGG